MSATDTFYTDASGNIWVMPSGGGGPVMLAGGSPSVVFLADASTVAVNAALGNDFRLTLTASGHTLASPSGGTDGQEITFHVTQGAGGTFTMSYGAAYEFSTQLPAPVLSTAAGSVDLLRFIYNKAKGAWLFVASIGGF
jgi:hypothetical protein